MRVCVYVCVSVCVCARVCVSVCVRVCVCNTDLTTSGGRQENVVLIARLYAK